LYGNQLCPSSAISSLERGSLSGATNKQVAKLAVDITTMKIHHNLPPSTLPSIDIANKAPILDGPNTLAIH
jgi:hypothetical protein